jgi:hypothetical protein
MQLIAHVQIGKFGMVENPVFHTRLHGVRIKAIPFCGSGESRAQGFDRRSGKKPRRFWTCFSFVKYVICLRFCGKYQKTSVYFSHCQLHLIARLLSTFSEDQKRESGCNQLHMQVLE